MKERESVDTGEGGRKEGRGVEGTREEEEQVPQR